MVLFTLDNRGVITLSEGKGLEALGLVPKEVVGKSVFDLYRDRPVFLEKARRALAGEPINATIELAGAVFEIRSSSLRAENGEVAGVIGVAIDVTERKRIVQRLKETEARYRTLVEHVPAVTYVQEATGSNAVTYVSPQIEPMLGYKPEECISDPEHWIKILPPADRERVFAEDKRTNETSEPFGIEYRQFAKDGRVVWVRDEAV